MAKAIWLIVFSTFVLLGGGLFAQVTYEQVVTSNGFHGQGAFESASKISIEIDARRSETKFKFTGSIMKHFNPKGMDVEITRLDKELFWKYNTKAKDYQETTFAEIRAMFEQGKSDTEWPAPGAEEPEQETDESEYEWQKPTVKVVDTGETQSINKFKCKRYIATVETIGKHKATGLLDTMLVKNDLWNSIHIGRAMEQIRDFDKRLAEKLGFTRESNRGMARLMSMYKDELEKLGDEIGKIEGYPIRSEILLTMTTHAKQKSEGEAMAEEEEGTDIDVTDIKGTLGGLFGKKAKSMLKKKVAKPKQPGTQVEIFQATTELKSLSTGAVDSGQFEVLAGFKRKN